MNENNELTTESLVEKKKPKFSMKYMVFLVIILGLAHVLDEYSTLAPNYIKSSLVQEFFTNFGVSETNALQTLNNMQIISAVMMLLANFFKGLQDRWGRKIIFILSVVGMTVGVFIQSISTNYITFAIGQALAYFFLWVILGL